MEFKEIATGLKFPEGPVAMDDGSVIVVEIPIGRITRVKHGRHARRPSPRRAAGRTVSRSGRTVISIAATMAAISR